LPHLARCLGKAWFISINEGEGVVPERIDDCDRKKKEQQMERPNHWATRSTNPSTNVTELSRWNLTEHNRRRKTRHVELLCLRGSIR
jgi:hypothetical protein